MIATSHCGFLKSAPNSFSAGALPRTPLGELTALPRHPSWFKGGPASKGRGVEEKGRKGIGEGEDRRKEGKGWKKVGEGRERKVEERRMEGKGRREEK